MEEVLQPDLCVIGAGSGGLSVAAAAAQFGAHRPKGVRVIGGAVTPRAKILRAQHRRPSRAQLRRKRGGSASREKGTTIEIHKAPFRRNA